jgi:hypothetical protein
MAIVGLGLAVWLLGTISVSEFRRHADLRLHEILVLAGD